MAETIILHHEGSIPITIPNNLASYQLNEVTMTLNLNISIN